MSPETTLFIGASCGLLLGYAVGFLVARLIYRSQNWPHT